MALEAAAGRALVVLQDVGVNQELKRVECSQFRKPLLFVTNDMQFPPHISSLCDALPLSDQDHHPSLQRRFVTIDRKNMAPQKTNYIKIKLKKNTKNKGLKFVIYYLFACFLVSVDFVGAAVSAPATEHVSNKCFVFLVCNCERYATIKTQ